MRKHWDGLWYCFSENNEMVCGSVYPACRPAYPSVFDCISTETGRQYGCTPVFLKIQTQSFKKVCKSWREQMQVRCQRIYRRALVGSYRSLTFAYFKPFLGLKCTAGPDWSKKFVEPMNFDFASKLYGSWPSSYTAGLNSKLLVISGCMNRRRGGRMHETKETNSDQRTSVQERTRQHQRKQHGALFLEQVFCGLWWRTTFADVNKIKSSECSASVYLKMWVHTLFLQDEREKNWPLTLFCFDWLVVHPQKNLIKNLKIWT